MERKIFPQHFKDWPITIFLLFIVTFPFKLVIFFLATNPLVFYKHLFLLSNSVKGAI